MKYTLITLTALSGIAFGQTTVGWNTFLNSDGTSKGAVSIGNGVFATANLTGDFNGFNDDGAYRIPEGGTATIAISFSGGSGLANVSGGFSNLDNSDGDITTFPAEWLTLSPGATISPGTNTAIIGNLTATGTASGSGSVGVDGNGTFTYSAVSGLTAELHYTNPGGYNRAASHLSCAAGSKL